MEIIFIVIQLLNPHSIGPDLYSRIPYHLEMIFILYYALKFSCGSRLSLACAAGMGLTVGLVMATITCCIF